MKTSRIRAAWRNAYRAARMGHEVAIHFGRNRRDSTGRYGFIIRPGGPSSWGHMGLSSQTRGAEYGAWLTDFAAQRRSYRLWHLSVTDIRPRSGFMFLPDSDFDRFVHTVRP